MKHVFVSSTFKDMQFERDALHTVAAVSLNNSLSAYGEQVYFGDLRWGVNTTSLDSEEGCRKVLEVCLDEIDDCRPYMIVLVGERYGWIPGGDAIRSAAAAKGIEIGEEMSVTQLEIEYGALLNKKHDGRIFFYFRELDTSEMSAEQLADYASESAHHKAKIDALKARVRKMYPDAVRTYSARFDRESGCVVGLEDFLETVTEDLRTSFLSDAAAEENLPWQMRAIRSAERYYFELARNYHDIEHKPLSVFDGTFAQNEVIVSFVRGASGTGKSTFLKIVSFCRWLEKKAMLGEKMDEPQHMLQEFHNLSNEYFSKDSCFEYKSEAVTIVLQGFSCKLTPMKMFEKVRHNTKLSYIPAERNLLSVIPRIEDKYRSSTFNSMFNFVMEFNEASISSTI